MSSIKNPIYDTGGWHDKDMQGPGPINCHTNKLSLFNILSTTNQYLLYPIEGLHDLVSGWQGTQAMQ